MRTVRTVEMSPTPRSPACCADLASAQVASVRAP